MPSGLPNRPSLEHLKKQARERLRELRVRVPGKRLADAQHAIAREYGFPSWPKLKAHVDAVNASNSVAHVLAVHLREIETGGRLGVALLVPSERYAATLLNGAGNVRERRLTPAVWREIENWAIHGDEGLPAEPPPLSRAVAAALVEDERPAISAHRFASFPMTARGERALTSTVRRLLPRLLLQGTHDA
jgi:hypothetical protein